MQIYVAKAGQQTGPFSSDQIQSMLNSGMISTTDSAWHEGLSSWIPLHQVLNIPPPIQPISSPPPLELRQSGFPQSPTTSPRYSTNFGLFLYIPTNRLIVMSIVSLGLYQAYWIYRNWRYLKERDGLSIQPFWRGIFSLFFIHSLFKAIKNDPVATKILPATFETSLAIWWIIVSIFGNLVGRSPDIAATFVGIAISLSSVCFLLPVQNYINSINEATEERPSFYAFSTGHIVCLVVGLILWLLILLGASAGAGN